MLLLDGKLVWFHFLFPAAQLAHNSSEVGASKSGDKKSLSTVLSNLCRKYANNNMKLQQN